MLYDFLSWVQTGKERWSGGDFVLWCSGNYCCCHVSLGRQCLVEMLCCNQSSGIVVEAAAVAGSICPRLFVF